MSFEVGVLRPYTAAAWASAVVVAALAVSGCVAASRPSSTPGRSSALPAASVSVAPTQAGDCCALGTPRPYALVTARPTPAGSPRPATSKVPARAGSVTVTPEFNEQVLDTNQDGLIDKLILTPTITVPTAGDYMANVQLFDRSGVQIESTGTGEIHLAAGSQPLTLEFNGTFIYKSGQWGPYTPRVTIVYFGPVTKIVLSDAQLDDTQAYDYVQFQHDRIAVDPESLSSKAVDTDGDGLYDELDIGGTVTVETPGEYDVNSGLYGGTSFDQIAAEYMTFQFVAGANSFTLVYKGSDIAKSGQDGPYTLFDLLVYLSADPMDPPPSIELKYVTPPFKASQFGG